MMKRSHVVPGLMVLGILFAGVVGCASPVTPVPIPPTQTPPAGWVTYNRDPNLQCGFAIDHPAEMQGVSQEANSWILSRTTTDPSGPFPNFIYISVIPADFKGSEPGAIYNYDPAGTQILLRMQAGESRSLQEDPTLAPWYTYTRLPDATLGDQSAQAYQNSQPWEFPLGTKEIRYYLQRNSCTFLVGGYVSTVGSGQPGAIGEDLFEQILATFRLD
jgi:hypothetical protein